MRSATLPAGMVTFPMVLPPRVVPSGSARHSHRDREMPSRSVLTRA